MNNSMRCVIRHAEGQWQAYCVDVDIRTSARTACEARVALDRLLERYCYDIDEGIETARAIRRAPWPRRARYWQARLLPHPAAGEREPRLACYTFAPPPKLLAGLA